MILAQCRHVEKSLAWTALCILDEAEAFGDPMVTQVCDYLLSITTAEGGVPFVLPSVHDYPRAPWWESGDQPPASLNPTSTLEWRGIVTIEALATLRAYGQQL